MKKGNHRILATLLASLLVLCGLTASVSAQEAVMGPEPLETLAEQPAALGLSGDVRIEAKGGTVTRGTNGRYNEGAQIEVAATADSGYTFYGWGSTGGGTFANAAQAQTVFTTPGGDATVTAYFIPVTGASQWKVIQLSSREAMKVGNRPFGTSVLLQKAVDIRAREITTTWSHTRPDGRSYYSVLDDLGIVRSGGGENIAAGNSTPAATVNQWMNSTGHRENIQRGHIMMGAGHAQVSTGYKNYWVQIFLGSRVTPEAVTPLPAVKTYSKGASIDDMGLYLLVERDQAGVELAYIPLISEMVSGYDSRAEGTQTVSVTYDNQSYDLDITISSSGGGSTSGGGGGTLGSGGGGSSSGGSSGGSRGGGGGRTDTVGSNSTTTTAATTASRSSNVNADGSVSPASIQGDLDKALAAGSSSVQTRNASSIAPSTLQALAAKAAAAGKAAVLYADTTTSDGKAIQGRLYVEPARLTSLTADLKLGVYTEDSKTSAVKSLFEKSFSNRVAVIRCDQQGSFGARLQIAARVNLAGMNAQNLVFYSYSRSNNSYTRIDNPAYFIDSAGYLHFYTSLAGDIVVSQGALARK